MLNLEVTSDHSVVGDRELEKACRDLYLELKAQADEGEIKPTRPEGASTERFTGLEVFHQLILSGISMGVFSGLYNVVKLWLDNRPTCEVTLTYPDGFQMKVSKLTLEQAEKLHHQHSQTSRKADV